MRTVQVNIYQFSELSDKAKERARDWYREGMAGETFLLEYVVDEFHDTLMPTLGFDLDKCKTSYEISYSQSDGASFTGNWYAHKVDPKKVAALKSDWPQDTEVHKFCDTVLALAALENASGSCESGRYHFIRADFSADCDDDSEHVEAFRELCRDIAHWLYVRLRNEYEYQTSNEAVDESIEANEYEFTVDGKYA